MLQAWRALIASPKEACPKALVDDAGVPIVARHVRHHHAEGFSLREIAEIVGVSKSQAYRLLVKQSAQTGQEPQMILSPTVDPAHQNFRTRHETEST
jgi:hypothetical protein